jgi:hypothetical protein
MSRSSPPRPAFPRCRSLARRVLGIPEGTRVVLEAEHGWLESIRPRPTSRPVERAVAQREQERVADAAAARPEAHTRDGVRIRVNANLGSPTRSPRPSSAAPKGCGLLRTEFLFLDRREAPARGRAGAPSTSASPRALGGGRSRSARSTRAATSRSPTCRCRARRIPRSGCAACARARGSRSSARPVRAILRVRRHGQCRVLLPMVTDVDELARCAPLGECARELACRRGGRRDDRDAGVGAAGRAAARGADFLSIGSNDLAQYTLAIDRGHPELARAPGRAAPAVLRLIALVADAARAARQARRRLRRARLRRRRAADPRRPGRARDLGGAVDRPRLKRTRACSTRRMRALARARELATRREVRELARVARARARRAPNPSGGCHEISKRRRSWAAR